MKVHFITLLGYSRGVLGVPQDHKQANELWLKGGELGCAYAYNSLGKSYYNGRGVEVDTNKGQYYWELAAMGGDLPRVNLAIFTDLKNTL